MTYLHTPGDLEQLADIDCYRGEVEINVIPEDIVAVLTRLSNAVEAQTRAQIKAADILARGLEAVANEIEDAARYWG